MFKAKTTNIELLAKKFSDRITELEIIFEKKTNVYIDYANVKPWANKLGWHIELKKLKQFLNSFDTIQTVKFYNGTLTGVVDSEDFMTGVKKIGFDVHTKPVKR